MKITVVRPGELGDTELSAWRTFQSRVPAWDNPFLAPEFVVAVDQVRPRTRVAVLEDGGAVVGFFPFERGGFGYGLPVAPGLADGHGLVHSPGLEWDADLLLRACGLELWEFDHLVEHQEPFLPFEVVKVPSPVVDLSSGFDSYVADRRRGSSRFRGILRQRRRLDREVGDTRFDFTSRDPESLRTLMRWKSAQYRRTGRTDRFSRAWVVELVEILLHTQAPGCSGRLSVVHAGDHMVAAHFGLSSSTMLPTWFPTYDPHFGRYSPGLVLHLDMARAAADRGISRLDLGPGPKEYKEVLKSFDGWLSEGRATRRSAAALLLRARKAPVRRLRHFVLQRPRLLSLADDALVTYGRSRVRAATSASRWGSPTTSATARTEETS